MLTKSLERYPPLTWFFIIIYLTLIFYFSSLSCPPQPLGETKQAPILEHILEFAILGFLLIPGFKSLKLSNFFLLALMFGIFYGITDEAHQFFVPGRDSSPLDVLADSVGILLGILLAKIKLR